MKIVSYSRSYLPCVLESLTFLQRHEHALTDTRVPASDDVAEGYFEELRRDCRIKKGKILIGLVSGQNMLSSYRTVLK